MGSFDSTCTVSGLPIHCGDKVRALMITENPYKESNACSINDRYFPRTFALKAEYNDYGSIEEVEDGPMKDLWMQGLQQDIVAKGVGDNSCHDVATDKRMSFEQLLEGLWERRVQVVRELNEGPSFEEEESKVLGAGYKPKEKKVPKGMPTMLRIKTLLSKFKGLLVSNLQFGRVRVRSDKYSNDEKKLLKAKVLIEKAGYPVMYHVGSGRYSYGEGELLVSTAVGSKDVILVSGRKKEKPLLVELAMIREDVWQALLTGTEEMWVSDNFVHKDVSFFKEAVFEEYQAARDVITGKTPQLFSSLYGEKYKDYYLQMNLACIKGIDACIPLRKEMIPFSVGLARHWFLFCKMEIAEEKVRSYTDAIAEQLFATHRLASLRYYWRPTYSAGPQFGEWKKHADFHSQMAKIARKET